MLVLLCLLFLGSTLLANEPVSSPKKAATFSPNQLSFEERARTADAERNSLRQSVLKLPITTQLKRDALSIYQSFSAQGDLEVDWKAYVLAREKLALGEQVLVGDLRGGKAVGKLYERSKKAETDAFNKITEKLQKALLNLGYQVEPQTICYQSWFCAYLTKADKLFFIEMDSVVGNLTIREEEKKKDVKGQQTKIFEVDSLSAKKISVSPMVVFPLNTVHAKGYPESTAVWFVYLEMGKQKSSPALAATNEILEKAIGPDFAKNYSLFSSDKERSFNELKYLSSDSNNGKTNG